MILRLFANKSEVLSRTFLPLLVDILIFVQYFKISIKNIRIME